MNDSILGSVKVLLGLSEDDSVFDTDILTHINMAISLLIQLGANIPSGFMVTGKDETWSDMIENENVLNFVRTYIYLKVRLAFDPPTGSVLEAIKDLIAELEWRINVEAEDEDA